MRCTNKNVQIILYCDKIHIYLYMGKFNTYTQREVLNPDTGELVTIESSKTFTTKISEDKFYMTFIDYMSPIFGLKPEAAKSLLAWMCSHAEYNTGRVSLSAADRKQICGELDISNNSITNYLKTLKKLKLINGEKGTFVINPKIFWKGELAARKELLKNKDIRITFSID